MIFQLLLVLAAFQKGYSAESDTTASIAPTTDTPITTGTGTTGPTTLPTTGSTGSTGTASTGSTGSTVSTILATNGTTVASTVTLPSTTTARTTTAPACKDKSTDCLKQKSLCTKTGYVAFMADLCPVSCGYCATPCEDVMTNCADLKARGYCENRYYTTKSKRASCAKTCNLCKAPNPIPCVDADTRCASWNKPKPGVEAYCASSFYTAATKKKDCAKTCGFC